MEEPPKLTATELIAQPLTLPCGLVLPNRLVKCPMQETLAVEPFYDPPIDKFENLYAQWADADYGLIITGQVQIDIRYLSIKGDVVCHEHSLKEPHFSKWKRWAKIAQARGSPCIVQLAHPGRMSPAGAGNRPADMMPICPSSVPVKLGDTPHTNQRTDDYGGSPEKRLTLLKRLVREIREVCPPPYCLSVKLNSADYMANGGLSQEEGLDQVKWLVECGMVDFVEISGGNAEQTSSKLHSLFARSFHRERADEGLDSFGTKTIDKAPQISESTRIREAYFTEFAEKVQAMQSKVPIQLSGGPSPPAHTTMKTKYLPGFRSRTGMADAIDSGVCQLIGLGRTAVLDPDIPRAVLLNPSVPDDAAFAQSHIVRGQWFANMIPVKVVGAGLAIQFFYYNMRRLGNGLKSSPNASIPFVIFESVLETFRSGLSQTFGRILQSMPVSRAAKSD
ncbi:hypothetical protein MMC11_008319 [Xylographa trunciseda]|nr:hypothetical protein [Xylographa trunciseda]